MTESLGDEDLEDSGDFVDPMEAATMKGMKQLGTFMADAEAEEAETEADAALAPLEDDVKDEVTDEAEDEVQEDEPVEEDDCIIIDDEPVSSSPPPPPVAYDPLLRMHEKEDFGKNIASLPGSSCCWCQRCLAACRRCLGHQRVVGLEKAPITSSDQMSTPQKKEDNS